ncbi:MAG TPA: hypothetical protein VJX67_10130 [Blastocatellia bacterium]|nr:hypothetical protein [Blastocatellia bacterium]
MINILSINCSLAFAPYLEEVFRDGQPQAPSVVRQGGSGLVLRTGDGLIVLHRNREARLAAGDIAHYRATTAIRREVYDVARMSDEVVLAGVNGHVLLSHPQSEMWLDSDAVSALLTICRGETSVAAGPLRVPDWLSYSVGAGSLLLSDQRTGRWVLLGTDHIAQMETRLNALELCPKRHAKSAGVPPTILVKGVTVHLQSGFELVRCLRAFAVRREVLPVRDLTPSFSLTVTGGAGALEVTDNSARVAITAKEAEKWAVILESELGRLNASQTLREGVRTVFADGDGGCWVLQWGDEVLVPSQIAIEASETGSFNDILLVAREAGLFTVFLDTRTGNAVALTDQEMRRLVDVRVGGCPD